MKKIKINYNNKGYIFFQREFVIEFKYFDIQSYIHYSRKENGAVGILHDMIIGGDKISDSIYLPANHNILG